MIRPAPYCVAIIPARGGSKRLPGKNLAPIAGEPLIAHSIRHAREAELVRETIVSTDDPAIAAVAVAHGASVVRRSGALADDRATSESALLHVLDDRVAQGLPDPDLVVFLQCTSPVRERGDIDRAVHRLLEAEADSLLSVCEHTRYIWRDSPEGPQPINYDFRRRTRDQDFERQYQENGSIYVFRPSVLRRDRNRLGGRIALYVMSPWSAIQVDSPDDLDLCRWVMTGRASTPATRWPERIALVAFDFDGVMTDNRVLVDETGREAVWCHRGDGLGIEQLRARGIPVVVVSKEENAVVAARCRKLRVACAQGVHDKGPWLARYLAEHGIDAAHVAYVGNDVNDRDCLRLVGLPVVVADADPSVRSDAAVVLTRKGGRGAVREFCDLVLERWPDAAHAAESGAGE